MSFSVYAEDYDFDYHSSGGWLGYTIANDALIGNTPTSGIFGAVKPTNSTLVAGLIYYDQLYKQGRLGYLYGEYDTKHLTLTAGMLRSDWGLHTNYLISPQHSPTLLKSNAIYTARYESDIVHRLGIKATTKLDDFKVSVLIGRNYALDENEFAKNTYVQDAPMNKDFGSLIKTTIDWQVNDFHMLRLGISNGNLSKKIKNDLNRVLIGYKYQKGNWTFTTEFQQLDARGKVGNFDEWAIFRDTFTYLAYDFPKFRLYGVHTHAHKNEEMAQYVARAFTGKPSKEMGALVMSDDHESDTFTAGIVYDLDRHTVVRLEANHMIAKGLERVFNAKKPREEKSTFFGFNITRSF